MYMSWEGGPKGSMTNHTYILGSTPCSKIVVMGQSNDSFWEKRKRKRKHIWGIPLTN
jgi:hypothetical protein